MILRNVRLSEAPSFGKPVLLYDVKSTGAQAYLPFAQEMLSWLHFSLFRGSTYRTLCQSDFNHFRHDYAPPNLKALPPEGRRGDDSGLVRSDRGGGRREVGPEQAAGNASDLV